MLNQAGVALAEAQQEITRLDKENAALRAELKPEPADV